MVFILLSPSCLRTVKCFLIQMKISLISATVSSRRIVNDSPKASAKAHRKAAKQERVEENIKASEQYVADDHKILLEGRSD